VVVRGEGQPRRLLHLFHPTDPFVLVVVGGGAGGSGGPGQVAQQQQVDVYYC
jgi:hypothetical protein